MSIIDDYIKGDVTRVIVDILNIDWPIVIKRHLLIKELLWSIDYPRAVSGAIKKEVPFFSDDAFDLYKKAFSSGKTGRSLKSGLVLEHAIPRAILADRLLELFKNKKATYNKVRGFQERNILRTYVTKKEDDYLNENGLRSKMPENWSWETGDPRARYEKVGIKAKPLPEEYR